MGMPVPDGNGREAGYTLGNTRLLLRRKRNRRNVCLRMQRDKMLHKSASASDAFSYDSNNTFSGIMPFRTYIHGSDYLAHSAARQIVLILLLLGYHIWLQIDFGCPCVPERNILHCYSYMVLPSLIIISLILWNDKRIGRILRFGCYHSSSKKGTRRMKFCSEFFKYFLEAASSGFLWCGSVLADGDWYVCCGTVEDEELLSISCMKESELSPAEWERKAKLKNESLVIGLACLLLTAVSSFVLMLPWSKWCKRRNHLRTMFEEAILEQAENILREEIEKAAAAAVKKSLASLSSNKTSETSSDTRNEPESEDKEKILLNLNADWEKVALVAGGVIESIPKKLPNNNISV